MGMPKSGIAMHEGPDSEAPPDGAGRPFGRAIADFHLQDGLDSGRLRPAEEKLLECCRQGRLCSFGKTRPLAAGDDNSIRPGFLRFLALGGDADHPVHESGVRLEGAHIEGDINLDHARAVLPVALILCQVDGRFSAFNARLADLSLTGSSLRGVILEDADVNGSVLLKGGCHVEGETRLTGAHLRGDLDCAGAHLSNPDGVALGARSIEVARSVFLTDGFRAEGRVRFSSATIRGDFACHGGTFIQRNKAPDEAPGRRARAGDAITLANASIDGVLWLGPLPTPTSRQVTLSGSLDLQGARVATFVDHRKSWPPRFIDGGEGRLACVIKLNGFVYDRLGTGAPTDSTTREKWLLQQQPQRRDEDALPQPFEQLMRVLREMGYDQDARRIGLLKESLMQPARVRRASFWARPLVRLTGYAWGTLAGYGYRSHRLFVLLLVLWLSCAWFFNVAEGQGLFAPADAQVWTEQALVQECEATRWTVCGRVAHFITFNAAIYAADVIFPFIDLGQQAQWVPLLKPVAVVIPGLGLVELPPGTVHLISWIAAIIGTACVILLGAILTGLLHRE
jgi:hypothetical protein